MVQKLLPLILFASAAVASAQSPSGGTAPATGNPLTMAPNASRFAELDRNHNGTLSLEEMNAIAVSAASKSSANRFNRMDTNHDGRISQAEYAAAEAAMVTPAHTPTTAASTGSTSPTAGASHQ